MTNIAIPKGIRSYLAEIDAHALRTATAPDCELAEHLKLIERQLPTIVEIRDAVLACSSDREAVSGGVR